MAVQDYKINYKSDFVLNINGDAGWAIPFCIKFWTGMPSQAYFVGFDGVKYVNCKMCDTPTQLLVMFDDHHLPIGKLMMQIAYHTTIEEFPGSVFDEVTNARDVIITIDGTDYQVMLDFTGEDAPELEFNLPAYANEAERIQNELQRQQNEAARIAAELQREQASAAAVAGAENVNAQLSGNILTVTNRQGVSTSVNTKGEQGEQGPVGPEGPQGETGISIVDFSPKSQTSTTLIYTATFSDGHTQDVAIPKGPKGDTGATGPTGPQGPQGQTGVSITGLVKTGETETDTLYNVTFSDGTTQAVAIPKGAKGDTGPQGPAGPTGPQGPMGDVAVITPEQQAAFTMYSVPGQNTDGPMTQKAVTDNYPLISNTNNGDLELSDENSNVLARFKDGQIKVKFFDSATDAPLSSDSANDGDLEFSDSDNNVLVRFKNGHIITKNFNSAEIGSSMLEKFKNKKIAIIGDSISTFQGWLPSDIAGYDGATYATYYKPSGSGNVNSVNKTWWYQMMQLLGLPVGGDTINVCAWSGSYVSGDSTSTTSAAAGCSTRRITDLAIRGWNPDIVIIFISCNDFAYDRPLGTWDVNSAIVAEGNITEMRAAYALMINKIHIAYPNARVFCCTNLDDYKRDKTAGYPSNNNNGVTTFTWNQSIKQIADAMACDVIDMHACGLNYANFQQFAVDEGTHPNAAGMSMMAQKAASELISKY